MLIALLKLDDDEVPADSTNPPAMESLRDPPYSIGEVSSQPIIYMYFIGLTELEN